MILLRTTNLSPETARFADRLAAESGHRLCFVVDERRGAVDIGQREKVGLTVAACHELGLHAPVDVGWRCGDYGFYLARRRFPDERFFWMIEYDVRIGGADLDAFFSLFARRDEFDLIAADYAEAPRWWYWTHTMAARGQTVWRCLFPVVRLSARAIDLLHRARRADRRRWMRRAHWPNDESFVATTVSRAGLRCANLNDFGKTLYDATTYTFHAPIDGDTLDERALPLKLLHPVLYGDDLRRKIERMAEIDRGESLLLRSRRRLVGAINHRLPAA